MKWNILSNIKTQTTDVKADDILKILLKNRGFKTKKEKDEFLGPIDPEKFIAKDLNIDEKELKKAVKRINKAIEKNEFIIVYGDYDADGICATAILWETLYKLSKNVLPYIPDRVNEGYGLNCDSISKLKSQNSKLGLIITVDHGITAAEKIKVAKELGIDVIVCDHHQLGKTKPKCTAILHTEQVCAAAIAWFLSREILRDKDIKILSEDYLDLVVIATIADLEPLVGINRSFVKFGLKALNKTERGGLLAMFDLAGLKKGNIGTYEVGFIIAPRLNAAGRMEHALESLRLLCTKDKDKAGELAGKLEITNKDRQLLMEETSKHVMENSELIPPKAGQNSKLLFITHESYHEGIIGLVAGKLVEQFYRPAIVVSVGEIYSKASARSINGFNIIEAIRAQSDLLVDAGGHPLAAGFTVETARIELLRQRLLATAEKQITEEMMQKVLKIDMELKFENIQENLWEKIKELSPFGIANPEPIFSSKVVVADLRTVGLGGKHLKLDLFGQEDGEGGKKKKKMTAIGFNFGYLAEKIKFGGKISIAYSLTMNQWNNQRNLELKIKDFKWDN